MGALTQVFVGFGVLFVAFAAIWIDYVSCRMIPAELILPIIMSAFVVQQILYR